MNIAISGAGIAGPTLAYWLLRAGHRPTLIERASHLRTRGYLIDLWGQGYTIAEHMGVLPIVQDASYAVDTVRFVDEDGGEVGSVTTDLLRGSTGERFVSLPRGDLAAALYQSLGDDMEALFSTTIVSLDEHRTGVCVGLSNGEEREFDLVIGADGAHSYVRSLAFEGKRFVRDLGYHVAAFDAPGYAPRDELVHVSHAEPGRQISRFAERGGRTLFLFVFANRWMVGEEPQCSHDRKRALMLAYRGMGWEWPRIAQCLATTDDIYFDRLSQIHLPAWSKGRVALVGDAAAAVSLLDGEGAGLSMLEAYILAGELAKREGGYSAGFAAYEARLRPFIDRKQRTARKIATSLAPRTSLGIWLRNRATRFLGIPAVANHFIGALRDDLPLSDYRFLERRT